MKDSYMSEMGRRGSEAPHETRGLQGADPDTRKRVAMAGVKARLKALASKMSDKRKRKKP